MALDHATSFIEIEWSPGRAQEGGMSMVGFLAVGPGRVSNVEGCSALGVVVAGFLREVLPFRDDLAPAPDMISPSLTRFVVEFW